MQECTLEYIPKHLKQNGREQYHTFSVGESLYFRCDQKDLDNPYKSISISELSHNRSGVNNSLSQPDDVLYSILEEEAFEKYDKEICELKIIDLNQNNKYSKSYTEIKNSTEHNCLFELFHEPEPCMSPHVVFRVTVDGSIIQKGTQYKDTIGKLNKIRNYLREEIASMIIRRQVSQSDVPS